MFNMNWETYKLMTDEQKLEWHFKFDNPPVISVKGIMNGIMYMMFISTFMIFMTYIIIIDPSGRFAQFQDSVKVYMEVALQTINLVYIMFFLSLIYELGRQVVHIFRERRWMKQNGIIYQKQFPFNIFK